MTEQTTREGVRIADEQKEIKQVFLESARAIHNVLKAIKPIALKAKSCCGGVGPLEETISHGVRWAILQYRRCELGEALAPSLWRCFQEEIEQLLREEKK